MAKNDASRTCLKCAHCVLMGGSLEKIYGCDRPEVGSKPPKLRMCTVERNDAAGACGPAGKLWEPKR